MLRVLSVGLSLLGLAETLAGPPSALPTRPRSTVVPAAASDITPAPVLTPSAVTTPSEPLVIQSTPVVSQPSPAIIQSAPIVVQPAPIQHAAPIPVVTTGPVLHPAPIAAPSCPCERAVRPGRVWLDGYRPVVIDDRFRYEPRIRDIRYAVPSSTLPGAGLGAPDTLPVIPSYRARDGYFRLFDMR